MFNFLIKPSKSPYLQQIITGRLDHVDQRLHHHARNYCVWPAGWTTWTTVEQYFNATYLKNVVFSAQTMVGGSLVLVNYVFQHFM